MNEIVDAWDARASSWRTDFATLCEFYMQNGIMREYMRRDLELTHEVAKRNFYLAHEGASPVARTLLALAPGWRRAPGGVAAKHLLGALSFSHPWPRAWFMQHFAVAKLVDRRISGALQAQQLRRLLSDSEVDWLSFFVRQSNRLVVSFIDKMREGCAGSIDELRFHFMHLYPKPSDAVLAASVREAPNSELVALAARRALGPAAAAALGLLGAEVELAGLARDFRRVGLERKRSALSALAPDGRVTAILLSERVSPGVNLAAQLDAWWVLPLVPLGQLELKTIAAVIRSRGRFGRSELVLTPYGVDVRALGEAGFQDENDLLLYTMNRHGMSHYHRYLTTRFAGFSRQFELMRGAERRQ